LKAERIESPQGFSTDPLTGKRGPELSGGASHTESRGGAPRGERADRKARCGIRKMPPMEGAPVGALPPSLSFGAVGFSFVTSWRDVTARADVARE